MNGVAEQVWCGIRLGKLSSGDCRYPNRHPPGSSQSAVLDDSDYQLNFGQIGRKPTPHKLEGETHLRLVHMAERWNGGRRLLCQVEIV
jgi:hypothetical protein